MSVLSKPWEDPAGCAELGCTMVVPATSKPTDSPRRRPERRRGEKCREQPNIDKSPFHAGCGMDSLAPAGTRRPRDIQPHWFRCCARTGASNRQMPVPEVSRRSASARLLIPSCFADARRQGPGGISISSRIFRMARTSSTRGHECESGSGCALTIASFLCACRFPFCGRSEV